MYSTLDRGVPLSKLLTTAYMLRSPLEVLCFSTGVGDRFFEGDLELNWIYSRLRLGTPKYAEPFPLWCSHYRLMNIAQNRTHHSYKDATVAWFTSYDKPPTIYECNYTFF